MEPLDKDAFPFATTVGDVTEDSAVVLLRAAPSTLSAGTHVHLHMWDEEKERWVVDAAHTMGPGSDELLETTDGTTLRTILTDLLPDTSYGLYLVRSDTLVRSETASFRTPPAASGEPDGRRIVFGASSCSGPRNGQWPSLARAAEANLDFFIFAGDTVYADGSSTVEDFRAHWDDALAKPALVNLTRSTPLIVTVDDHEFRNDFSADTIDPALFTAGLTAFRQAMPHGTNDLSTAGIYRRLSWGPSLDIFVLDTRTERNISANTYMSEAQMAWLLSGLADSTATHKVIVNSVPITDMASLYGSGGIGDRWSGYPAARNELLSFLETRNISAFFVSGDFHFGALTHVGASYGEQAYGLYEAFTGPSGSDINPIVKTALATTASEQYLRLHDTWTYTRFDLDTEANTLLVSFIDDYGVTISEDLLRPLEAPEPPSTGTATHATTLSLTLASLAVSSVLSSFIE
jgi:phosphodiesterase/alkaline phosphatase D-like protein